MLGVRPEDLLPREDGCRLGTVTFDVVEHMGHETMAHFALAGGQHVARLAADAGVQPGDRLDAGDSAGCVSFVRRCGRAAVELSGRRRWPRSD